MAKYLDKTGLDTFWAKIKNTFQTLGNKVTSVRATSSASDDKYPSEKAVATALDSKEDRTIPFISASAVGYYKFANINFTNINSVYAGAILKVVCRSFEALISVSFSEYNNGNELGPILGNVYLLNVRSYSQVANYDFYVLRTASMTYDLYLHLKDTTGKCGVSLVIASNCSYTAYNSPTKVDSLPTSIASLVLPYHKKVYAAANANAIGSTSVPVYANANGELKEATGVAPLASPALTGTPTAPTAASGTNTTQIATTAFVQRELGSSRGLAYYGSSGTASFKIAEISMLPLTTTHEEQYVFSAAYSKYSNNVATSQLSVCLKNDKNNGTTEVVVLKNTILSKDGFGSLDYVFKAYADRTTGKLTIYAVRQSGSYTTVQVFLEAADSERNNLLGNVTMFSITTSEVPEGAVPETTVLSTYSSGGVGSLSVPVYVNSSGEIVAMTAALPISLGGTGNTTGNAATATKPSVTLLNNTNNLNDCKGSSHGDVLWYMWKSSNPPTGATLINGSGNATTATMEVIRTHSGNYSMQIVYTASTGVFLRIYNGGTWNSWNKVLDRGDVTSTYSSTGTDPVNGTAVASAIANKQDKFVALVGTNGSNDGTPFADIVAAYANNQDIVARRVVSSTSGAANDLYQLVKVNYTNNQISSFMFQRSYPNKEYIDGKSTAALGRLDQWFRTSESWTSSLQTVELADIATTAITAQKYDSSDTSADSIKTALDGKQDKFVAIIGPNGGTGVSTFNDVKTAWLANQDIVARRVVSDTENALFQLVKTEYTSGQVSKFVFQRSYPVSDGATLVRGQLEQWAITSSGWPNAATFQTVEFAENCTNAHTVDNHHLSVLASLPSSYSSDTIYFV